MIAALFAVAIALANQSADASSTAEPSAAPAPPADCSIVNGTDASAILGYPVQDPDSVSRSGGTCFYISQNVSDDGTLSYAIVTAGSLPQRRAYFRAYSRRCAPAVKGTLNELACRPFIALSQATDMNAYYAARSGAGDATPVSGLGDAAVTSGNALYVRRGDVVYECSVLRGGDFDLGRATKLAQELLGHTKGN